MQRRFERVLEVDGGNIVLGEAGGGISSAINSSTEASLSGDPRAVKYSYVVYELDSGVHILVLVLHVVRSKCLRSLRFCFYEGICEMLACGLWLCCKYWFSWKVEDSRVSPVSLI